MVEAVYVLCALTSIACAALLMRGYGQVRVKLLFWSAWCFVGLAINNVILLVDRMFLPAGIDLSPHRTVAALIGMLILLYGLIWEST